MTINNSNNVGNVNNVSIVNNLYSKIDNVKNDNNYKEKKLDSNNKNKDKAEIKVNNKKDTNVVNFVDNNENESISVEEYESKIFNIIGKNLNLELKDKDKIIELFKDAEKNGKFNDLINHLDKNNKLKNVYKSLGTLVNQGEGGAITSSLLAIFTLGISTISESKMNRAYDLVDMMKKNKVPKEIIDKLKQF